MLKTKTFKFAADELVSLLNRQMGAGLATNQIMVDGRPVGYMYRERPDENVDSGWRFLSGEESQEYADDPDNWAYYDLNTIANYDRTIIPYLNSEVGAEFERVPATSTFSRVD
jgi:hypothetical protein